jgi:hypothetical protein
LISEVRLKKSDLKPRRDSWFFFEFQGEELKSYLLKGTFSQEILAPIFMKKNSDPEKLKAKSKNQSLV